MQAAQIAVVVIATISVIGFAILLAKRSNLLQLRVKHDHEIGSEASRVADRALDTVDGLAGKAHEAVDRIADTVQPVTNGIGGILDSIADRIRIKQTELNALQSQSIALAQEIERLKNRQINVTEITAQLKLALIGVEQKYTSLMQTNIQREQGGWLSQPSATEYLGLRTTNYRIQVGVDVEKLQFQLSDDARILVYGLRKPIVVGIERLNMTHHLDEVRKFTENGEAAQILLKDSRIKDFMRIHIDKIHDEIQNSQSIKHLTEPNARFAQAFLQACLSGSGYRVEESIDPLANPLRFGELCLEINRIVGAKLDMTSTHLLEIEDKSRCVESEMLAIASGKTDFEA